MSKDEHGQVRTPRGFGVLKRADTLPMTMREKLTTRQVAELCDRTTKTVRRWVRDGHLSAEKDPRTGSYIFEREEVQALPEVTMVPTPTDPADPATQDDEDQPGPSLADLQASLEDLRAEVHALRDAFQPADQDSDAPDAEDKEGADDPDPSEMDAEPEPEAEAAADPVDQEFWDW